MRIAYLFEPNRACEDPFFSILPWWLNGLAESQNDLLVIGRSQDMHRLGHLNPRVRVAEAVRDWTWKSLPSLAKAILPFSPQVVHAIIGEEPRLFSIWPALQIFLSQGTPVVISPGDGVSRSAFSPFNLPLLGADYSEGWTLPSTFTQDKNAAPHPNGVFIPGPISSFENWNATFSELAHAILAQPRLNFSLGFQWSDLSVRDRLRWRPILEGNLSPGQRLETMSSKFECQRQALIQCEVMVISPLQKQSWWRPLFLGDAHAWGRPVVDSSNWASGLEKRPHHESPNPLLKADRSINSLARYYQLLLS